ncbi:MAG: ABC transporter substrate-binding protein [Rubrivivax sp.]|nr:ABC transporter substrate-binding protein [Rubrivivax sp.]
MKHPIAALLLAAATTGAPAQDKGQINLLCSVELEWCALMSQTFERETGVKVNMIRKSTGEVLAQLTAERANPKTDVWFGGTGDPHLQAAEQGLTEVVRPAALDKLQPWAQSLAQASDFRSVGVYLGPLGLAYNPEVLARKKIAPPRCWKDLTRPEYKGEVQNSNPNSSGTAYTAITTFVDLWGEEAAFAFMKALHPNVSEYTRSGAGPVKNAARGETGVAIGFLALAAGEIKQGLPLKTLVPCEGTGYEIGAMSLVKGARNAEAARRFYDWSLTPAAQALAAASGSFTIPSHKDTALHPLMPPAAEMKFVNHDLRKYGSKAERTRLIARWEREVLQAGK